MIVGLTGKEETAYYLKVKFLQKLMNQKRDLEFCAGFLGKRKDGEESCDPVKIERCMKGLEEDIKLTQDLILSCEKEIRRQEDGRVFKS